MLTIVIDGIAYGMLLFILACGLSVTLGLMNLINLAHGALVAWKVPPRCVGSAGGH